MRDERPQLFDESVVDGQPDVVLPGELRVGQEAGEPADVLGPALDGTLGDRTRGPCLRLPGCPSVTACCMRRQKSRLRPPRTEMARPGVRQKATSPTPWPKVDESADTPGSVPRPVAGDAVTAIHLGRPLLTGSSALPAHSTGPVSNVRCLGLLRVGFTEPPQSPGALVVSYTTVSPLPAEAGGLFSVALSRGSPRVAVGHHPALRSPDVPRQESPPDAAAWPTHPSPMIDAVCRWARHPPHLPRAGGWAVGPHTSGRDVPHNRAGRSTKSGGRSSSRGDR